MRRIKLTLLFLAVSPLLFAADYRFVKIDFPNATPNSRERHQCSGGHRWSLL